MVESNTGINQRSEHREYGQQAGLSVRSVYLQRVDSRDGRKANGIGALAGIVRDTVYTTFDALRGRYDR